ncbi:MAG: ECF-type sigma factor [Planctomycetota bacterium]
MEEHEPQTVEKLLGRLGAGDSSAAPQLLDLLHDELHAVAHRHMSRQRAGHTLQTTALLNEAWMKLAPAAGDRWQDRQHFVRAAARAMRFVLVDHARRRLAKKRQQQRAEPLADGLAAPDTGDATDVLALDEALHELGENDAELLSIVELRYFGGLTLEEAGRTLGMTVRQVHRRWTMARGWLRLRLESSPDGA